MLPGETKATAPARVKKLGKGYERGTVILEMTLQEGRNRQIRRMMEMVNYPVIRLVRVQIGTVPIGKLAPGQWRELTQSEVTSLMTNPKEVAAAEKAAISAQNRARISPKNASKTDATRRSAKERRMASVPQAKVYSKETYQTKVIPKIKNNREKQDVDYTYKKN